MRIAKIVITTAFVLCLFAGVRRGEVVCAAAEKTLTVDANANEVAGDTYTTIQAALDYISNDATDKDGWTITVKAGTYTYFTVSQNISNLTITEESGATIDASSASIQLCGDTITLEKLTFTAADTAWSVPIIKDSSSNAGILYDSMVTISDCTFTGTNAACAIWITRLNSTIKNCTFTGFTYAFEIINETSTAAKQDTETTTGTITITGNTITGCDYFIHYGVKSGISLVVTDNTVTGTAEKVCTSLFAWEGESITVSGNTFTYAAFGLQNAINGVTAKDFLSTNTFVNSYTADDYFDYKTWEDYSVTYYAPADVIVKWSVSDYAGDIYSDAISTALSGHEYENTISFSTVNGSGAGFCMGLSYFGLNVEYIPTGSITIDKTVEGGNSGEEFSFAIKIDTNAAICSAPGYDLTGAYGDVELIDGEGTFTLSDGKSVTVSGIPEGAAYTVTEMALESFTTTVTTGNEWGTVIGDSTVKISFLNTGEEPEPETPEEDDTPEPETEEDDTSEPETTEETTTEEAVEETVEETVDETVDPTAVESAPTEDNAPIELLIALAAICGVAVSTLLLQARREQEQ